MQNISNQEALFSFDELFFSRTDNRGIILAGNDVFQRISQYSWAELLKKPHNIIRHQDMPKGVFWLLWSTIKAGNPIGAYVKNKAKDGKYYWVFAIVTPIEGGFLSVRIKPSSAIFKIVEEEYKNLLSLEYNQKLTHENSANILLNRIKEFGFADYQEFMSVALSAELNARNKQLNISDDEILEKYDSVLASAKSLLSNAKNIYAMYQKGAFIPLNLQVKSAQLGEVGNTIAVIANNYNIITNQIKDSLELFLSSASEVFNSIHSSLFLSSTASVQKEILDIFSNEIEKDNSKIAEVNFLKSQESSYRLQATESLKKVLRLIMVFQSDYANVKRLSSGLQVTKVMGKVESSRIDNNNSGLIELMADLDNLQKEISSNLKIIESLNNVIDFDVQILSKYVSKKQAIA